MKQLVAYITSGYPDPNFSTDLALSLGENGVDTLELGVPFSDPVADGPVIEQANYLALERGICFEDVLNIAEQVAPKVDTLLMGYFNPFYQYGIPRLLSELQTRGVEGLIIPDLPYEEALTYDPLFEANGIANIGFVAPTDSEMRVKRIVAKASKFIYLVAYAGITGSGQSEALGSIITAIKHHTDTPVYVGFGVNEHTAKEKAEGVDGVIVGSAFVNILLQENLTHTQKIQHCCELSRTIKDVINT